MRIIFTILLTLLLGSPLRLSAQVPQPCNNPAYGALQCQFACVVCKFDTIIGQTNFPGPVPPTGQPPQFDNCLQGQPPIVLTHARWFGFIAGSSTIGFNIKDLGCTGGGALEAAVVYGCGFPNWPIACGPVDPANPLIASNLTVGALYYLVIDGIDGANCRFQVNVAFGSTMPPTSPPSAIDGPSEVCPGATVTYVLPAVDGAVSYYWLTPPGSQITGGLGAGNQKLVAAAWGQASTIEVKFGNTGGNVCVTTNYACDTAKTLCLQVTNQPIAVTELPDITLCYEELPFTWDEEPFTAVSAPGTVTLTSIPYVSHFGCDSLVRQKIIAKPRKQKILPLQRLCNDECFEVNGFKFCETGTFSENLIADDGCDSVLNFSILKVRANASVTKPDTLTCRKPTVTLQADTLTTTGNSVFYKWVDNLGNILSTTQTLSVTTGGPFYFIVNNVSGSIICSDTAIVTVPINQTLPNANAGPDRVITCDQPQIQLQGTGSVGPQYSYLWLASNGGNIVSGSTTLTPTINATGSYRLRVTNEINGCTQVSVAVVTAAVAPPTISATGGTISCEVATTTLGSTTNAAGATYAWSGPGSFSSNLPSPTVNTVGTYTVVVTDSITGCTNSATADVVGDLTQPGAAATGGTLTCATNSVTLNGSSPATNPVFAWSGPNGFSSNIPNPSVNVSGDYLLTVTGENGCSSTASASVGVDNTPPGASLAVAANLNCNNANVNITASSNVPASSRTHLWTLPNGSETHTDNNPILQAAAPGTYTVVITNTQNGCTSSATVTVVQNPVVTASISGSTNVSCNGQQNGSAVAIGAGGNGNLSFAWNSGDNTATASNLNEGIYTVTVTDGENCSATATVSITQPTALTAAANGTPQMANGAADGTASVTPTGGTPGYTYLWSNMGTTQTITDLLPGSYTVTVTDANGCTAVSIATINAFDCIIEASVDAEDASCFDADNGTATVVPTNGTAPFTYAWSTNETTVSISNLAPGIYTVVVTDAANCPETISFTISEPTLVRANATATPMSGPATGDGTATASPTGGVGPYTYEWSNQETTQTITGLAEGSYTVTVTDANGCTAVQTVVVLAGNCGVTTNFLSTPALCNGQSNGTATVVVNGGNAPFTYQWSSSGTEQTESNLGAGTYTVTVTDVNDCEVIDEVTITEPTALAFSLDNVVNTACANLPEGSITVLASGGTNPLQVTWSNGQNGLTAVNLVAGSYTATLTDGNGCTATLQAEVDAVDNVPPVIEGTNFLADLGAAGSVTLNPQTLGLVVTDNCGVDEVTFQPASFDCSQLGPHNVVVTAIDDAGNVITSTIVVTVEDNLQPTLVCPPSLVRCFGDDVVQYPAPVATDNCLGNGGSFDLVSGLPSGAQFPPGATATTYTYTDADGNVGSCTFEVTILSELTIKLDTILDDKGGLHIGAVHISTGGSLSPYTFQWFRNNQLIPNAVSEDLENIGNGSYTVLVTDEVGCTGTAGPFVVDSLVSTKIPEWGNGLLIMPNPTTGRLSVIFPTQLTEDVHFTTFDMTGRLVFQQTVEAPQQMDFDLSNLADGMYTILIRVKDQVLARKIVVSK